MSSLTNLDKDINTLLKQTIHDFEICCQNTSRTAWGMYTQESDDKLFSFLIKNQIRSKIIVFHDIIQKTYEYFVKNASQETMPFHSTHVDDKCHLAVNLNGSWVDS